MTVQTIRLGVPAPKAETVAVLAQKYMGRIMTPDNFQELYEELVQHLHGSLRAMDSLSQAAEEAFPEVDEPTARQEGQRQVVEFIQVQHSALSNDFLLLAMGK